MREQHRVLDRMVKHGYITEKQAAEAKQEELSFAEGIFPIQAPHFVFYVKDVLIKMCEKGQLELPEDTDCSQLVYRGGLRVPLLRANHAFRAVALPEPGETEVDIVYDPASFKFGLLLSLWGLALAVAFAVLAVRCVTS